jgi:hypothetical protein
MCPDCHKIGNDAENFCSKCGIKMESDWNEKNMWSHKTIRDKIKLFFVELLFGKAKKA